MSWLFFWADAVTEFARYLLRVAQEAITPPATKPSDNESNRGNT